MNQTTRLAALSAFLKAQRSKISPQSVGLPPGIRRRTPGLRREEVAQLAGVSATWYTWLEQGRDIQASSNVLDAIAAALRLTHDERNYLYALALDTSSGGGISSDLHAYKPDTISAPLQKILQELHLCPTIVSDRRCQIVGWNEAAAHVFLDFEQVPEAERNMIRLLFTRQELRRLAGNWEQFASGFLSIFRAYYGQYVEDSWYDHFCRKCKLFTLIFNRFGSIARCARRRRSSLSFAMRRPAKCSSISHPYSCKAAPIFDAAFIRLLRNRKRKQN